MADWEFLLQKQGDRSWLPLKPPRIEIPEGRYRVVAHSNRTNTDVEIRITHYCTDQVPPKRRSQKRTHRTNSEGLMVVIPFSYIKPGIWDLQVKNDIMSDLLGDTWQHGIQLRVVPQDKQTHQQPAPTAKATQSNVGAGSVRNGSSDAAAAVPVKPSPPKTKAPAPSVTADTTASHLQQSVAFERTQESRIPLLPSGGEQNAAASLTSRAGENVAPVPLSTFAPLPSDELAGSDRTAHPDIAAVPANDLLQMAEQTGEQKRTYAASGREESSSGDVNTSSSTVHRLTAASSAGIGVSKWTPHEARESPKAQEQAAQDQLPEGVAAAGLFTSPGETLTTLNQHSPNPLPSDELAGSDRTAHPETSTVPVNDLLADSLQMAEQILQQLVDRVWQEPEPALDDQSLETPWPRTDRELVTPEEADFVNWEEAQPADFNLSPASPSATQPALLLTLDQETLVARRGQSLTMTGRVDVPDATTVGSSESNLNSVFQGTLRYQLRDPQNSQVLVGDKLPLPKQVPPFAFNFTFELPPNFETRLILGEITLCDAGGMPISTQSFSITADLRELLGTILHKSPAPQKPVPAAPIPQESQPEPPQEPSPEQKEERVNLDLPSFNQVEQAKNLQSFQQSPGTTLPPQLTQASGTKKDYKSLQLPKLPPVQPSGQTAATDAQAAQDSLPVETMLLEGIEDEAGSMTEESIHPTFEEEEGLQPTSSILSSGNTLGLEPSFDPPPARSDAQLEKADATPTSLPLAQDEVPSPQLEVGSLPQTQTDREVAWEADTALAALLDFGLESTSEEQQATDSANRVDLGLGATGEKLEIEKPEIIEIAQASDSPESYLPKPPLPPTLGDASFAGVASALAPTLKVDTTTNVDREESLPPSLPSNWQEDLGEFLPPAVDAAGSVGARVPASEADAEGLGYSDSDSGAVGLAPTLTDPPTTVKERETSALPLASLTVPPTGEEEREELLSVGEQEESQNPQLLEQEVQPEPEIPQQGKKEVAQPVAESIEQSFEALRMQDRFWLRLNAIATDTELSEWLRSEYFWDNSEEIDLATDDLPPDADLDAVDADMPPLDLEDADAVDAEMPPLKLEDTDAVDADIPPLELDPEVLFGNRLPPLEPEDTYVIYADMPLEELEDTDLLDKSLISTDAHEPEQSTEPTSWDILDSETADATETALLLESPLLEEQNQLQLPVEEASLDLRTQEIVVEDELPAPAQKQAPNPTQVVDYLSDPLALLQMFEEVQVPTPELNVPGGELTAGQHLTVWVKLPPYRDPIYVKVWIQDRETRSVLDGPRLLKDFSPTSSGELETSVQLTVPFGSLSIGFEAIAVDMYTQRESHKVTVDRIVVPPDIPTVWLDEFEE